MSAGNISKSILEEYVDACKLVEETEADLRNLRSEYEFAAFDIVKGSNPNFPFEPRTFRIEGISYSEYKNPDQIRELEKVLKERRDNAKKVKLQVEVWINAIPIRMQRLVRMRYLIGMPWDKIATELGYNSESAARMELKRFIDREIGKEN